MNKEEEAEEIIRRLKGITPGFYFGDFTVECWISVDKDGKWQIIETKNVQKETNKGSGS